MGFFLKLFKIIRWVCSFALSSAFLFPLISHERLSVSCFFCFFLALFFPCISFILFPLSIPFLMLLKRSTWECFSHALDMNSSLFLVRFERARGFFVVVVVFITFSHSFCIHAQGFSK